MERGGPYSPSKGKASITPNDDNNLMNFLEGFKSDFCDRLTAFQRQLQETQRQQEEHRQEVQRQLVSISTKSDASAMAAEQALAQVADLKDEMKKDVMAQRAAMQDMRSEMHSISRPVSDASTEAPRARRPRTSGGSQSSQPVPPAAVAHASVESASSSSFSHGLPTAPENDGFTILAGGFEHDTPAEEIETCLNNYLNTTPGVDTVKAKRSLGSLAYIKFTQTNRMWQFLKTKKDLTHGMKTIWFTLPKSVPERHRDSCLVNMLKAVKTLAPNSNVSIGRTGEGMVIMDSVPVARYNQTRKNMEISAQQLALTTLKDRRQQLMDEYIKLISKTPAGVGTVSDWA